MARDTVVSIRYPLEEAAHLLAKHGRHVSLEVAALVALELCERAAVSTPELGVVFLDIAGRVQVDPQGTRDDLGELLELWSEAVHPSARVLLEQAGRPASREGRADAYLELLEPIERATARLSLMRALEGIRASAQDPASLEQVLSGLDDEVLARRPAPDDRPILLGPKRDEPAPQTLGRFDVFGRLGGGGMAEVLLARDPAIGRPCVVKRMLPETRDRHTLRQMFTDEARLGLCLSHPHIVQVLEYCEHGDEPFIVMEWAYGLTFAKTMRLYREQGRELPIGVVLRVGEAMTAALAYAYGATDSHGRALRVVHRDVTPQNVVLQFDGHIKLLDFGVARSAVQGDLSVAGSVKGKYGYMSPEQSLGLPVDDRSDVFCVGICLYEALTGEALFPRDERLGVVQTLGRRPVEDVRMFRPDVPPTIAKLLSRMLDAATEARPSIDRVASALRTLADRSKDGAAFDVAVAVQTLEPDWQDWRARVGGGTPKAPSHEDPTRQLAAAITKPPRSRWWWVALALVLVGAALGWALITRPPDGAQSNGAQPGTADATPRIAQPGADGRTGRAGNTPAFFPPAPPNPPDEDALAPVSAPRTAEQLGPTPPNRDADLDLRARIGPENPESTDPENANPENADPENADPENADPENADPENTDPENTDPENTDPENMDQPDQPGAESTGQAVPDNPYQSRPEPSSLPQSRGTLPDNPYRPDPTDLFPQ